LATENVFIPATEILMRLYLSNSAAVRALEKTRGYVVALSSVGAQLRIPGSSDANISKHAVNRLVEFITLGEFRHDRPF
jgi:NAD(P)-dependent dehydrogenase (short-subunit alcohol dehydrogenase family)